MKTFKKYIDEAYETGANGGYRLNKDVTGRVPTDELHRFASDSGVLDKLNTWIGDIADREHISVQDSCNGTVVQKSRTNWNRV